MRTAASLLGLLALAGSLAGAQEIRRWRTPDGAFHFGDNPPAGSVLVETGEPWRSSTVGALDATAVRVDADPRTEDRRRAADACQKEIAARVRDPRTLEIGELSVSAHAPGTFTVRGTASTRNAHGRPVQSSWTCRATAGGADRWRLLLAFEDLSSTEVALDETLPEPALASAAAPMASAQPLAVAPYDAGGGGFGSPAAGSDGAYGSPGIGSGTGDGSAGVGSDLAAISPSPYRAPDPYAAPPRLSPNGRAVDFASAPEIHWGREDRKTIAFCVENFTNDWRKVAIRIADEQHQIGFVGPRATECNEIDTTSLVSGDAAELVIDERVASPDEVREFGALR